MTMRCTRAKDTGACRRSSIWWRAGRRCFLLADDCRVGQLVVPALLAAVERDPQETEPERKHRDEVGEKTSYELGRRGRPAGADIDDPEREHHLPRRRR